MSTNILTCPQCGAPLSASRFAASAVCGYCHANVRIDPSVVNAAAYRKALADWNNAAAAGISPLSIGDAHWGALRTIAHGEISDVYLARRTRWPSELVLFKVVRSDDDAPLLENEYRVLEGIGEDLGVRVPEPVAFGRASNGHMAAAFRWANGFTHTFEMVREVHPGGIEPIAAIWVWRRILETLAALHRNGIVHGAITPKHLLVQQGEHGVRLVGFSCAGREGDPLRLICTDFESLYPAHVLDSEKLARVADMIMAARCVSYLLGNRKDVPGPLADLLRLAGADDPDRHGNAWSLREDVGAIGQKLFGPPSFHPIDLS